MPRFTATFFTEPLRVTHRDFKHIRKLWDREITAKYEFPDGLCHEFPVVEAFGDSKSSGESSAIEEHLSNLVLCNRLEDF
jgi:hypothetical protein